jgi:predicted glycogen debranching enzyme
MEHLIRMVSGSVPDTADLEPLLAREWLVTNGLGGYASGTVAGVCSRRYHGLLVAALPAPLGRVMMFNHLFEHVRLPDGSIVRLSGIERMGGASHEYDGSFLTEFGLETGLPIWRFRIGSVVLEKRVFLAHLQNTVYVSYRLLSGGPVRLIMRPSVSFRPHDAPVNQLVARPYHLSILDDHYELSAGQDLPPLRMILHGQRRTFAVAPRKMPDIMYRTEESRGYEAQGELWSPGRFVVALTERKGATLVASTEPWSTVTAVGPQESLETEYGRRKRLLAAAHPAARSGVAAELVLAADQFIIKPAGRVEDAARAHAAGDEVRTVIAGYHWFTDWGRDTMISLEGLTLATGRYAESGYILRTFAHYIKDGLIPNMFPEGEKEGLYHTADGTLWFFHAIDRYVEVTGDRATLQLLLPKLGDVIERHWRGTRFGIGADPRDGLLRQGAQGYPLTWMDAKVGDWVVTPRRGKAVEINALWYNALRLMADWVRAEGSEADAARYSEYAAQVRHSFNERFWNESAGYLYDVVDGEQEDDASLRPNQVLALSLRHAVLEPAHWQAVLDMVQRELVTPVGLRSLAPSHADYKSKYYGDLRSRDAAYHQGTVWAWLIGPFIDAWQRVYPEDRAGARRFLDGFTRHLSDACIGSISEIFDAEPPFRARGCAAQAWSVAEVLRCWIKTHSNV